MAFTHAVVTCRAIGEVDNAHTLLSGQLLQVAIHGAETHPWEATADTRKHFLCRGVIMRGTDDIVNRRQLTGLALLHDVARSSANEARTAPLIVAV